MGTEGDDFKCTAGIKMAFLIPRKSNKPHPLEIPLADEALPHPPPPPSPRSQSERFSIHACASAC